MPLLAGEGLVRRPPQVAGRPGRDRLQRHLADADLPVAGFGFIAEAPTGTLWLAGSDRRLYRFDPRGEVLEAIDVSGESSLE